VLPNLPSGPLGSGFDRLSIEVDVVYKAIEKTRNLCRKIICETELMKADTTSIAVDKDWGVSDRVHRLGITRIIKKTLKYQTVAIYF
jgi:hypothetical protein